MSEPAKKRRSPWLFIALVLAIYVLGIGPAYRWGFSADPVASRWTYRTYWPLATLSRYRIPGTVLAAYINLWSPPMSIECDENAGLCYRWPFR